MLPRALVALIVGSVLVGASLAQGRFFVVTPKDHAESTWAPLVVLFPPADGAPAAQAALEKYGPDAAAAGLVTVAVVVGKDHAPASFASVFAELRRRFRIEQGGMHALLLGDGSRVLPVMTAHASEFQTCTLESRAWICTTNVLGRVRASRGREIACDDTAAVAQHLRRLHDERVLPGAEGVVAKVLDDFHDAAAVGDEQRYFAILPDDAVFLGTDASERWTGAKFREFALPYFQRDSAWTYVSIARHVRIAPSGDVAWFDEVLDNAAYGECRGSGVLVRRGDAWVLQLYDLTIPIPNDLAGNICQRIRAFAGGQTPAVTTVVCVRHAEKVDSSTDAALSDAGRARAAALARALRDLPVAAAYASEFQRTSATLAPLCAERSLEVKKVPAAQGKQLAKRLLREHLGQTVLVCGHSNTVPELLAQLGVKEKASIADDEYDRLFVVTIGPDGAAMVALRY